MKFFEFAYSQFSQRQAFIPLHPEPPFVKTVQDIKYGGVSYSSPPADPLYPQRLRKRRFLDARTAAQQNRS